MMSRWMIFALAPLWSAPALAADVATADCVRQHLDAATAKNLAHGLGDPDIDGEDMASDADYEKLGAVMVTCQARHGWSDGAVDSIMTYTISDLGMLGVSVLLEEAGVDPVAAGRAVAGISPDDRALLVSDPESGRIGPMMIEAAARADLPVETDRQKVLLTVLASYTAQKADALRAFTGQ